MRARAEVDGQVAKGLGATGLQGVREASRGCMERVGEVARLVVGEARASPKEAGGRAVLGQRQPGVVEGVAVVLHPPLDGRVLRGPHAAAARRLEWLVADQWGQH